MVADILCDRFGENLGFRGRALLGIGVVVHMEEPLWMVGIKHLMVREIPGEHHLLSLTLKDVGDHPRSVAGDGMGREPRRQRFARLKKSQSVTIRRDRLQRSLGPWRTEIVPLQTLFVRPLGPVRFGANKVRVWKSRAPVGMDKAERMVGMQMGHEHGVDLLGLYPRGPINRPILSPNIVEVRPMPASIK